MVLHRQHLRELQESLTGSRAESTRHDLYHVVLYLLEHGHQTLGAILLVPQLASIGHHWQAHGVEHEAPVCHGEAVNQVAKDHERFDGSAGPVAHDMDMGLPFESTIDEEPQVSQGLHRPDLVGAASAWEGDGGGGGDCVVLKQLLEV
jgi:hypothetical protein